MRQVLSLFPFCLVALLSRVGLSAAPWTPLPMEFYRQEYWSRLPFPTPGDLLHPGIKPVSLTPPALAAGFFTPSATWEAHPLLYLYFNVNHTCPFVDYYRQILSTIHRRNWTQLFIWFGLCFPESGQYSHSLADSFFPCSSS